MGKTIGGGGYSRIRAGSLDAAVALARGCPMLGAGGGVEICELTSHDERFDQWLDTKGGIKTRAKQRLEVARTADQQQLANGNEFWGIPFDLACVSAIEGNDDEAFRWLDKAYEAGWRGWPQASWSPLLDPLRQDGRFRTLMRRIDEDVAAMRRRAGLS